MGTPKPPAPLSVIKTFIFVISALKTAELDFQTFWPQTVELFDVRGRTIGVNLPFGQWSGGDYTRKVMLVKT